MKTFPVTRKNKEKYIDFDKLNEDEQEQVLWKLLLNEHGFTDGYIYQETRSLEAQVEYMRRVVVALTVQLYRKGTFSDEFMERLFNKAQYGF